MGRRGNGEGYVFQLATGNWAGQLMDGYKEDGKKNIVCFYASTRGEVLQKMQKSILRLNMFVLQSRTKSQIEMGRKKNLPKETTAQ